MWAAQQIPLTESSAISWASGPPRNKKHPAPPDGPVREDSSAAREQSLFRETRDQLPLSLMKGASVKDALHSDCSWHGFPIRSVS